MTTFRTHHMCLDISGALLNWSDSQMRGMFKHDDGRVMTPTEAKVELMEELAKGRRVLPIGDPCEGFDFQKGCPGHASMTHPTLAPNDGEKA